MWSDSGLGRGAALAALITGLAARVVAAQPPAPGSVRGDVVDTAGSPLQGARLRLPATGATARSDIRGHFTIARVLPGRYELSAWHESSSSIVKQTVKVGAEGATGISVRIPVDRSPLVVVPDKYGKPRQSQLGY